MELKQIAEVEWDFVDDDNPNWKWCMENATFVHKEACEFILHIGDALGQTPEDIPYWLHYSEDMRLGGCTEDFIAKYLEAKDNGAERVLFWS